MLSIWVMVRLQIASIVDKLDVTNDVKF